MPKVGIVIGTGPSLADVADELRELKAAGKVMLFGINRTFEDFDLDCWIQCDDKMHYHYGQVDGDFDKWHYLPEICDKYGYRYIEGVWLDGLSTDPDYLSLGHASGWQALQLAAVQYRCDVVLLVGHDMRYEKGKPRHYFSLSDAKGEYPKMLRKHSLFLKPDGSGLLTNYRHIAKQAYRKEIPPVWNCTPNSAMSWFPFAEIADFV